MLFQIETFSFHIPPSRFAEVLLSGVPAGRFAQSVQNMAGHPVDRDALAETLRATIAIWPGFRRRSLRSPRSCRILERNCFSSTPPLTQVMVRAWLTHGVIDLLSGYTSHEVEQLPARSNDRGLGSALEEVTFTSSEAQPGKSGVVQIKHRRGLRITEEIAVLMHTPEK